jgi:hypothetical protein
MVPYDQPEAALVHFFRCCKLAERGVLTVVGCFQDLFTRWVMDVPLSLNAASDADAAPFGGWA